MHFDEEHPPVLKQHDYCMHNSNYISMAVCECIYFLGSTAGQSSIKFRKHKIITLWEITAACRKEFIEEKYSTSIFTTRDFGGGDGHIAWTPPNFNHFHLHQILLSCMHLKMLSLAQSYNTNQPRQHRRLLQTFFSLTSCQEYIPAEHVESNMPTGREHSTLYPSSFPWHPEFFDAPDPLIHTTSYLCPSAVTAETASSYNKNCCCVDHLFSTLRIQLHGQ